MDAPAKLHPSDQTLNAFGLGKLDDASAESVSRHLEECPECRRQVAEMPDDSFVGQFRGGHQMGPLMSGRSEPGDPPVAIDASSPGYPPDSVLPPGLAGQSSYEIKRELGRGGMGVVYLAHNKLMGRDEVLKVVGAHLLNKKGVLDRFLREVRSAAKLHHPNIVTAYSALPLGDSLALSMEYVAGYDLSQLVSAKGPLSVAQACNFVYQAALGLQHAHERGMVHRDIKPSNLMLAREGNKPVIKVLDFGLAKVTSEGLAERGLTHEGQMLGTPDFIAPEQIKNARSADIRADIYSLGCTLYYLLAGRPPFQGDSLWDLYQAHFSMDAGPLNLIRPEVSVELAALAAKMMAKDPNGRFLTPGEVAQALVPFFKSTPPAQLVATAAAPRVTPPEIPAPVPVARAGRGEPANQAPARALPEPLAERIAWESLIDLKKSEASTEPGPVDSALPRRRPPWAWPGVIAASAFGVLALGVIIYLATNFGRVKIVVDGPEPLVAIDGETARIEGLGEPIWLRAGTHDLLVRWKGGEFVTRKFVVTSGDNGSVSVEYEPKAAKSGAEDGSKVVQPREGDASINRKPQEGGGSAINKPRDSAPRPPYDPKQFTIDHGEWIVQGDELLQTESRVYWPCLMFGDDQWTDYDFTVDLMRLDGTGPAFLMVRGVDKDNNFTFDNPGWGTSGVITVTEKGRSSPLNHVGCRFESHKWYTARVRVRGSHIECTLRDGEKLVVFLEVDDARYPRGRVGLRTWEGTTCRFKNIRVTAPGGEVLWQGPPAIGSAPIACWTFESDAQDQIGSLHGTLLGGAFVRDGRLHLDGKKAHMRTAPLSRDLREKTLEAWVSLANLDQRAGGLISIEHGATFDAIVLGETEPAKWIAGSEWLRRANGRFGSVETAKPTELVHMAIAYDLEGGITIYRQGKPYAERYIPRAESAALQTYPAGESYVLLGQRATAAHEVLHGEIEEARLYDRALTAEAVAASYRAGPLHHQPKTGVVDISKEAVAVKSTERKSPPPPAGALGATARSPVDKARAAAHRGGGAGHAEIAIPFRVATNGLAGRQFIDPVKFGPDPYYWFNEPRNPAPWTNGDAFAQLTSRATLVYPRLPVSRYVCEVELTTHMRGSMKICLGEHHNCCEISLDWFPAREMVGCALAHWYHGGWGWNGGRDFAPERRISLKLVVGDGRQTLFHDNKPILANACWPVDCCLWIVSETADSAVIHRCSLRPLTAQDVADCGWTTPPTALAFKAGEAAGRLAKISEGYPAKPKSGERFAVKTTGTPMVWIAPGEFEMGMPNWNNTSQMPRHRVKLTRGYWIGQTEVTQGEFSKVTGTNPSRVTGSPYLPVDWVAWDQAAEYCRKLTAIEHKAHRLPPGYEYRLPTEAEWEYAGRAGSDDDFSVPQNLVWSRETSGWRPHEVAESQPNKWGLYDMHGNAMEWCFDAWYEVPKGVQDVTVDPFKIGNPEKDSFVVRGGAWWSGRPMCSSHWRARNHNDPNGFRGFRVVLGPEIRGQSLIPGA